MKFQLQRKKWLLSLTAMGIATVTLAQQPVKRPPRAEPPSFKPGQFSGVFFDNVNSVVQGRPPEPGSLSASNPNGALANNNSAKPSSVSDSASPMDSNGTSDVSSWGKIISPSSLEDAIKNTKLRLDQIVTTPAKFAGGGYNEARREFSLLAILFGIVAQHPEDVRWKDSSISARDRFARIAANAKVGSPQAYQEAKLRLQDLSDLLSGNSISDPKPDEDKNWGQIVDRQPVMRLLEWLYDENLKSSTASKGEFTANSEDIQRQAELLAALSSILKTEGMPDADAEDYIQWNDKMMQESLAIVQAVKSNDAEMARQAAGQIGQACSLCHDAYR